jgi:hypothetical protein
MNSAFRREPILQGPTVHGSSLCGENWVGALSPVSLLSWVPGPKPNDPNYFQDAEYCSDRVGLTQEIFPKQSNLGVPARATNGFYKGPEV